MKILLVTDSGGTNIKALLAMDGTNDVIQKSSVNFMNEPNMTGIDLLVVVTITASSQIANKLIEYIKITKTPALLGYINYGGANVGVSSNNAWGMLGLCSGPIDPSGLNIVSVIEDHDIFFDNNIKKGESFSTYASSSDYMSTAPLSTYTPGAIHLTSVSSGHITCSYYPRGIITLSSLELPVEVFTMGWLTDRVVATATAKSIIKSAMEFLITKAYAVKGKVQNTNKEGLERKVTVFDQETLRILGQTTSNTLGEFQVDLRRETPVVILVEPFNVNNNAQVRYNVIPQIKDQL